MVKCTHNLTKTKMHPRPHVKPSRSEVPAEFQEIERFGAEGPATQADKTLLSDNVFDTVHGWEEKSRDDAEFIKSVQADLGKLATTNFESPGDNDEFFGAIRRDKHTVRSAPTRHNFDRKPPRPNFKK